MTFNIYVPSYKRYDAIKTHHLLDYCTYVVRKSEYDKYAETGVSVISVDDALIGSIAAVTNWIIENTPEDVVCVADDDLDGFSYRLESIHKITCAETVTTELERIAQLLVDLGIGYASLPLDSSIMYYDAEFKFVGRTGPVKIFNKSKCKSRVNDIPFISDVDFELQELLRNRVILIPNYFCQSYYMDLNYGGSNCDKTMRQFDCANLELKYKWGKYFIPPSGNKVGRIDVKR